MNELALFAGAGGGILGGHLLGWRTVCAVEWEAYPASILCARQNDGFLPPFPIWDDVQTFDGKPWAEIVDVVSGGFPCQDISAAGKGGASKPKEVECGKKWRESLAKLDPNSLLWKIPQCSLLEDSEQSLEIWPKWGSMRSGECFPQPMLEQTIKEKEFGFVPNNETFFHTPCTTGMDGGSNSRKALKKRMEQWPTPRAQEPARTSEGYGRGLKELVEGKTQIKRWPTPDANCGMRGTQETWLPIRPSGQPAQYSINQAVRDSDSTITGGKLNPMWVEWLMGWPLGWTDLKPLEMDKCHFVQQPLGDY